MIIFTFITLQSRNKAMLMMMMAQVEMTLEFYLNICLKAKQNQKNKKRGEILKSDTKEFHWRSSFHGSVLRFCS